MIDGILNEMIKYFGNDAKRINHALKVYGFAKAIISQEQQVREQIASELQVSGQKAQESNAWETIEIAALLHDIGIKEAERKYNSSAGKYQEMEGPAIAAGIMEKCGVEPIAVERVCYLVGHHHTYGKIDGIDFQVLVEADFIVNAFEDGMEATQLKAVYDKYMKTSAGRRIFEALYLADR